MPNRLVLFDIDGTLMTAAGAGRHAIVAALHDVCGVAVTRHADHVRFGGKTDPQICREVLDRAGWEPGWIADVMERLLNAYVRHLARTMPVAEEARLMPGILPLLDALRTDKRVCVGLLTGNVVAGARIKLGHFGLADHFALGAYGCDDADRHALPPIAVARARALTGIDHLGKQVVIIGDTEHDVACGRSIGVKTVAVATGAASHETLAGCQPDHLFPDLASTREVLAAILN